MTVSSITAQSSTQVRLGDRLLSDGLLTQEQLDLAGREAERTGRLFGETLVDLGLISETVLSAYLSQQGVSAPLADLAECTVPKDLLALVPYEMAVQYQALPLERREGLLTIAMADPYNIMAIDAIERHTKSNVKVMAAVPQVVKETIERVYAKEETITQLVDQLLKQGAGHLGEEARMKAPMIRLCDLLIVLAANRRATDIHIEPDEHYLRIRFRVDGVLGRELLLSKVLQPSLIARLKLMANLDITEKRMPQDGRLSFDLGTRRIDLRVSSLPTNFGESLVLRLLDKTSVKLDFSSLGFHEEQQNRLRSIIQRPYGIILVTGPTGSGKTTTLYTALQSVNAHEKSVFTLEDPIEYQLPLIRQTQINPDIGMSFASGLRALLRQDPDVILIGEIRDQETADLAMRAALTGHLVFSTLHTNDAVGAIPRLIEMGVEPYVLASALIAVIGQRLVRGICPGCKIEREDAPDILRALNVGEDRSTGSQLWMGTGCDQCGGAGYRGRLGIFELLMIDEALHGPIVQGPDVAAIRGLARKAGMESMRQDGLRKAFQGRTTIEEVLRVTNG